MRPFLITAAPVTVFLSHLWWNVTVPYKSAPGVLYMAPPMRERILAHLSGEGLWMGASYALVACFMVIVLGRFRDRRREALAGAAGGTLLAGGIYAVGCFMLGCCGSPMAVVWLSLLGGRYANVGGVFLFLLTLLSTSVGLWMLNRKDAGKTGRHST
jgi:MFS family permease